MYNINAWADIRLHRGWLKMYTYLTWKHGQDSICWTLWVVLTNSSELNPPVSTCFPISVDDKVMVIWWCRFMYMIYCGWYINLRAKFHRSMDKSSYIKQLIFSKYDEYDFTIIKNYSYHTVTVVNHTVYNDYKVVVPTLIMKYNIMQRTYPC